MRINKYIAQSGYASRRKADELIDQKKVYLNGMIVNEHGIEVTDNDEIVIEGKKLEIEEKFYIKLNKPTGYISSNYDPHNSRDLNTLLKLDKRFFCAGRLDMDSHGLMIITNDGDLVNALIHPKYKIDKKYIVKVTKLLTAEQLYKFSLSVDIGEGQITSDAKIKLLNYEEKIYEVTIHQGFNRQIRRMFESFSSKVIDLQRIQIGEIKLGNMSKSSYLYLNEKEIKYLMKLK